MGQARYDDTYGEAYYTSGEFSLFVGWPTQVELKQDVYIVVNMTTGVREAEFTSLAHAMVCTDSMDRTLQAVRNGENLMEQEEETSDTLPEFNVAVMPEGGKPN